MKSLRLALILITVWAMPFSPTHAQQARHGVIVSMKAIDNRGDDETQATKAKRNVGSMLACLPSMVGRSGIPWAEAPLKQEDKWVETSLPKSAIKVLLRITWCNSSSTAGKFSPRSRRDRTCRGCTQAARCVWMEAETASVCMRNSSKRDIPQLQLGDFHEIHVCILLLRTLAPFWCLQCKPDDKCRCSYGARLHSARL
jgi:hypothetical protein